MPNFLSTSIRLPSIARHRRKLGAPSGHKFNHLRRHRTSIHVLDDDSLLHVFYLCRPILLDEEEYDDRRILQGGNWDRERWWYRLVRVCKRWRCLILGSASYLGLSLLCTYGTPIADMVPHSPPLPLTLDYVDEDRNITAEDERVIFLALQHRDRVRRIRFLMRTSNLRKLLLALNEEFKNLEHLYIRPLNTNDEGLTLPESFQAPNIHHLVLVKFALPLGSPLLVTAAGLVTLSLQGIPSSVDFHPDKLLRWLSFMPQIETLRIGFHPALPNHEVESQLLHMPIATHVTLSKLRCFGFEGVSAYLAELLPWMTTPLLEKLGILFFDQVMSPSPFLAQFIGANNNFKSRSVELGFHDKGITVCAYPHDRAGMYAWYVSIARRHPVWSNSLVASYAAQLLNAFRPALSSVVNLILEYERYSVSSDWFNQSDRRHWREILGSFGNVNTLHVPNDLIRDVSRSLQPENGESPMDVLPRLKTLSYSGSRSAGDKLKPFIKARRKGGRAITLSRRELESPFFWRWD